MFFFQAEDGIRDSPVTGVQTCALPISIQLKVDYEVEYMEKKSFSFDLYIIWLTLLKIIKKDGVSH